MSRAPSPSQPFVGARWWKFDFHTHTPASLDTHWAQPGAAPLSPEDWLHAWMDAEIDCVAITDHNSGAWIDELKKAYADMREAGEAGFRELHLFPGVEISVNGGWHLLAIFDPSATTSDIDTLLGAVGYHSTKGDSDGVTRRSPEEVVRAVLEAGGVAIPAHATDPKGLLRCAAGGRKPEIDATTLRQVLALELILACEDVDPSASKPQVYEQARCNWTEVLGSDWHGFDEDVKTAPGTRFTWIKMSEPSLEGLRLALLDGNDFSVKRSDSADLPPDPNRPPEHFIESLRVSETKYMGRKQPAELKFSPWFNAIVGGRGTGKSTTVHALRLLYGRQREVASEQLAGEAARVFDSFAAIPKNPRTEPGALRDDTWLEATVTQDGLRYQLSWSPDTAGPTVEPLDEASPQSTTPQAMSKERFPIRILSQGQIAALASGRGGGLLEQLDHAAGTHDAKSKLAEAIGAFLSLRARARELRHRLVPRAGLRDRLDDIQRKLAAFEHGDGAETLKQHRLRANQRRELERQLESTDALAARIAELAEQLVLDDPRADVFAHDDDATRAAASVHEQLRASVRRASAELRAAAGALRTGAAEVRRSEQYVTWEAAAHDASTAYAALSAELEQTGMKDPSRYGELVQDRQAVEKQLAELELVEKDLRARESEAAAQRARVRDARRALTARRQAFLRSELAGNDFVRIEVVPYGDDREALERALRVALGQNDGKFREVIRSEEDTSKETMVGRLFEGLPRREGRAEALERNLDDLAERLEKAASGEGDFGRGFDASFRRICEQRPEVLDRLLVFAPDDTLDVSYSPRGDGKDFRPIEQASAGQQAAAMLAFFLAHGSEPLVLDQPEDDLDNHLIYQLVVRQIRDNKQRRQLIVVTHNPNVVVNGDAEMVHALEFREGQCRVAHEGSLQNEKVREEVCKVMEGGREAFERRYKRLGGSP